MKIETTIPELEAIRDKAAQDYHTLPDDGSDFPQHTPMKELKLEFLNLAIMANGLALKLTSIQKTGTVV